MMNKKGFTILAVLFGIVYFMVGMITYQLIKPDIAVQRGASNLDCANTTDWGDMGTCLILDGVIPLIIITIIATAGGMISDGVLNK